MILYEQIEAEPAGQGQVGVKKEEADSKYSEIKPSTLKPSPDMFNKPPDLLKKEELLPDTSYKVSNCYIPDTSYKVSRSCYVLVCYRY